MLRWSTFIHKWLALVVGVQVLGWVLGGLVMTAIPIERVRSEHRAAAFQSPPLSPEGLPPVEAVIGVEGDVVEATLKATVRGPVWLLKSADGAVRVRDAVTGRPMPPMPPGEVRQLAGAQYEGPGRPVAVRYLPTPPQEAGKPGPLWRVDFDDRERTAFYLSPDTGEVVSRRSNVWRVYDALWRVHILNFGSGEDFNHPLLVAAAALTLAMTAAGLVLLWIRLARDLRHARRRRGAVDAARDAP